ncbi:MAG: FABP family protein [Candidatus Nanopelagicales bacterium]
MAHHLAVSDDAAERGWPAELAHLSWLIGRWGGIGEGGYSSLEPFRFEQIAEFACDGRPFLEYRSVTWIVDEQNNRLRTSATESGYLRSLPENEVEMLLVHPTGYAELWLGRVVVTGMADAKITGARMTLDTDAIVRTESAPAVDGGRRLYGLVEGKLLWTYDMLAVGEPLGNHVAIAMEPLPLG